ncbi:hypothetical protein THAOC_34106, partial [Thalassiosira oceanica]
MSTPPAPRSPRPGPAIASKTTPERTTPQNTDGETGFPQLAAGEISSDQGLRGWGRVGRTEERKRELNSLRSPWEIRNPTTATAWTAAGGAACPSTTAWRTRRMTSVQAEHRDNQVAPVPPSALAARVAQRPCRPPQRWWQEGRGHVDLSIDARSALKRPNQVYIKVCKSLMRQQLDDSNSVPKMSEGLDFESDDEDGNDKDVMVPRPTVLGDSLEDIRGDIHVSRKEKKEREIELETRRSTRRTARDKEDHQRQTCKGGQPPW